MTTWISTEEKDISWEHCGRPAYWENGETYCSKCQEELDDELFDHLVALFIERISSSLSDSPYAYADGKSAFEKAMKEQTAFTEREIWVGAHKKHPTFIRMPDENEGA